MRRSLVILRNVVISSIALLVLAVGAGAAYTWYVGQDTSETNQAIAQPAEPVAPRTIPHVKPAANAPVGVSIQTLTSPVAPGDNASVQVKTTPDATCNIIVLYDKKPSKDSGLVQKKADEFGMISWAWTVESSVPLGKWPVKVTCVYNKKSAVVQGDLVVAPPKR